MSVSDVQEDALFDPTSTTSDNPADLFWETGQYRKIRRGEIPHRTDRDVDLARYEWSRLIATHPKTSCQDTKLDEGAYNNLHSEDLQPQALVQHRLEQTRFLSLFSAVSCAIGVGLLAIVGLLTHSPFIFPSLGPTAFLFFTAPTTPAASPRNAILGHTIGVLAGYFSLVVTGLTAAGPLALPFGPTLPRIIAVMVSLSLTASLMVMLRASHPPAGATTLMISLGLIAQPGQLVVVVVAVVLLTILAFLVNRFIGIPVPFWKAAPHLGAGVMNEPMRRSSE